jgi:hypothetical protein
MNESVTDTIIAAERHLTDVIAHAVASWSTTLRLSLILVAASLPAIVVVVTVIIFRWKR